MLTECVSSFEFVSNAGLRVHYNTVSWGHMIIWEYFIIWNIKMLLENDAVGMQNKQKLEYDIISGRPFN